MKRQQRAKETFVKFRTDCQDDKDENPRWFYKPSEKQIKIARKRQRRRRGYLLNSTSRTKLL